MPRPGPKGKTTRQKERAGNPGHRPLPEAEPKGQPVLGLAPEWLPAEAKRVWDELFPVLFKSQRLEDRDVLWFEAVCVATVKYRKAVHALAGMKWAPTSKAGSGQLKTSPHLIAVEHTEKALRLLLAEGGLTPTARGRVLGGAPAPPTTPERNAARPSPWRPKVHDGGQK